MLSETITVLLLKRISDDMAVTPSCTGFNFTWGDAGESISWTAPKILPEEGRREALRRALTTAVYDIYYQGGGRMHPWQGTGGWTLEVRWTWTGDPEFINALDVANQGQGHYNPGWRVVRVEEDGAMAVTDGSLTLWVSRDRHLGPSEATVGAGDVVSVKFPAGRRYFGPGQYCAIGDTFWSNRPGDCVRIYFRIDPQGAPSLVEALSSQLNEQRIGFRLKLLSNPTLYEWRRDSAVLYTPPADFERVRSVVKNVYDDLAHWFKHDVPAFCKFLEPGLALAEDPVPSGAQVESFGMNRSRLVAEGLTAACGSRRGARQRLDHLIGRFLEEGVDLERPWLNPGSTSEYDWT